jgi:hypothetical protein
MSEVQEDQSNMLSNRSTKLQPGQQKGTKKDIKLNDGGEPGNYSSLLKLRTKN